MTDAEKLQALAAPFAPSEIEWRIGSSGSSAHGAWARVLAYVTARGIMDRLDAVLGPMNWRTEYREFKAGEHAGVICGLSIRLNATDEFVTKWDGADPTDVESFKGAISDSLKRAAVQWGLGRELYSIGESWAQDIEEGPHKPNGSHRYYSKFKDGVWRSWNPPRLPGQASPSVAPPPAPPQSGNGQGEAPARSESATLAEQQRQHEEKDLIKRAVAKCSLSGTKSDLQSISDFADSLVDQGRLSKNGREEINKAVKKALKRIQEVAESPHNPENRAR